MDKIVFILFDRAAYDRVNLENEDTIYKLIPRLIDINPDGEQFVIAKSAIEQGEYFDVWGTSWLTELPTIEATPDELFLPPEVL